MVAAKTLTQKNRKLSDENIQDLVTVVINKWKVEYDREVAVLKTEIQEIKASQEFVSSKYYSLNSNCDSLLLATSKKQEAKIQQLKTQSASLEVHRTKKIKSRCSGTIR